jgi:multiple antibiotic resistance protein
VNPFDIVSSFIAIFAIVNPMGAVTSYAAMTQGYTKVERHHVVKKAVLVAFFTLIIFALIGQLIFEFFSITVDSFRVAGGIIILLIAIDMVRGQTSPFKLSEKEKADAIEREQVGVIPLGIPLLAGPGAITTVMIETSKGGAPLSDPESLWWLGLILLSVTVVMAISFVILRRSDIIFDRIGRTGTKIFSRLFGLILAAVAVQFIVQGLLVLLPGLG